MSDSPPKYDRGKLIERALDVLLVYTVIGVVYAAVSIERVGELEAALKPHMTVFADLVALLSFMTLWPLFLISSLICSTTGCGLY